MSKVIGIRLDFLEEESEGKLLKKVSKQENTIYKAGILLNSFFHSTFKSKKYLKTLDNQNKFRSIIMNNIQKIYNNFINKNNLLCWGAVQSGKTDNIISLSMFFLDYDYDIVIILGGVTNLLYEQTNERIKNINILEKNFLFLNKQNFGNYSISSALDDNKKILINLLKESSNLKKIINLLELTDLSNKKILIIDDESDFGSINIGSPESRLYSLLKSISLRTKETKFLEVTATPYANIMSHKSDELSPEAIIKLEHDTSYTGLNFFTDYDDIYKIVSSFTSHKEIIEEGLKWYFASGTFYTYINNRETEKFELLINIDLDTSIHSEIYDIVSFELNRIKNTVIDIKSLERYLEEQLLFFVAKFNLSSDDINDTFLKIFENLIFDTKVEILNGTNKFKDNFKSGISNSKIIIGGTLVSRGFTFEKMLTEIMLNSPESKISADTLLQRARWFGYRKNNNWYEFMKIITTGDIKKAYDEVYRLDKLIDSFFDHNNVLNDLNAVRKRIWHTKFTKIVPTSEVKYNGK